VECLEGRFDTFGTFGFDFTGNLTLNGEPHQSPQMVAQALTLAIRYDIHYAVITCIVCWLRIA
jgi:hypothetical protein